MSHRLLIFVVLNLVVAGLGLLWGYTSFKYNWLNVGGGVGDIDFWDLMRSIVPYVALSAWLLLTVLVVFSGKTLNQSLLKRIPLQIGTILLGPITMAASDWYFHRGFPISPL